jgi:hypothetical protein
MVAARRRCCSFSKSQIAQTAAEQQRRKTSPPELGRIVAIPQVGGLHHRYDRHAA